MQLHAKLALYWKKYLRLQLNFLTQRSKQQQNWTQTIEPIIVELEHEFYGGNATPEHIYMTRMQLEIKQFAKPNLSVSCGNSNENQKM